MQKNITKSKEETQKFAKNFAKNLLAKSGLANRKTSLIVGLYGNLGAGKTTFIQGFAKGIGIKEKITSPTFVIFKKFKIAQKSPTNRKPEIANKTQGANFKNFIHIDAYRIENPKEFIILKWNELIKNPYNVILIEWADKIKKILPKNYIKINFKFIDENKREITISKF